MSGQEQKMRYTRARNRKRLLDVDLNAVPPCESRVEEGASNRTGSQDRQAGQGGTTLPAPIDVEAFDDDVIVSSPRAFAEAKINSRKNRGPTVIVDVDSEESSRRNKRGRTQQTNKTIINCDLYINLEGGNRAKTPPPPPPPPPPPAPKEPNFSCPVCMGPLVEEVSTKCGHIFCKACIKAAIAAQTKCPTCRRRTTAKDIIRIYLPATQTA